MQPCFDQILSYSKIHAKYVSFVHIVVKHNNMDKFFKGLYENKNLAAVRQAEDFLQRIPQEIVTHADDFTLADQFRTTVVDLIMQLQK